MYELLNTQKGANANLFESRLMNKPYCAYEKSDGAYIRQKKTALKRKYIQYNSTAYVSFLCFDIDKSNGAIDWHDKGLPIPSTIVINPANGHAHLYYALRAAVCRTNLARQKPLRLLAVIEHGMGLKLESDLGFAGFLGKTPHHEAHKTLEPVMEIIYDLSELAEYVELPKTTPNKRLGIRTGLGRNIELFDALRKWAYKWTADYRATKTQEQWHSAVLSQAEHLNNFTTPLPLSEVKATAKSVAKWCWRNYTGRMSDEAFSKIQSQRAKRKRKAVAREKIEKELFK
jgi:Replicase family/Primase C terminal 1 (PriCT-1)